jgi:hypothetical protein
MIIRLGKSVRTLQLASLNSHETTIGLLNNRVGEILIEALQAQKVRGLDWIGKYDSPAASRIEF